MPRYELHIRQHLDETRAGWFEGLTITHQNDGTTMLAGVLPDQSALVGVLMKIHNPNLTLITMREIDSDNPSN